MPRIVFASDSHLNKHYARMTPDQLARRRQQLREAWRESVDYALSSQADVYIHGGDLFDGPNPRATELTWAAEQFQRLGDAGLRTFLIGGNHDIPKTRLAGSTPQRLFEKVRLAEVFVDPTRVAWWTGELGGLRLAIGGLPPDPRLPRDADPFERLVEPIARPAGVDYAILVTHYAVEGTLSPLAEEATIRQASIAALEGVVDQLLVGHIHTAREMEIGGVKLLFPGPTERLSFGELDLKCGFAEIELRPGRPRPSARSKHIHTDPQPMRRETISALDLPAEAPTEWLAERIQAFSAPDQILQLRLQGPLQRAAYQALRLRELWQLGSELNFYFDLDRHLLTIEVPEPGDMPYAGAGPVSTRGEIARVAEGFLNAAEDAVERELVAAARDRVLALYGSGEIGDDDRDGPEAPAETGDRDEMPDAAPDAAPDADRANPEALA